MTETDGAKKGVKRKPKCAERYKRWIKCQKSTKNTKRFLKKKDKFQCTFGPYFAFFKKVRL